MKKILFFALSAGFLIFGFSAYMQSQGTAKNKRIYQAIRPFSPYYLEKRFGGLQIRKRGEESFKEKPDNMEVFHRLDALEKAWGKQHLRLSGTTLTLHDDNGTTLKTLTLKTPDERQFVHTFYGL